MFVITRILAAAAAVVAFAGPAFVQDTVPIKRIPLQRFEVPGTNYETVIGLAEIAADVQIGRHTHPGPESGYVISGGFILMIDGEAPRELGPGDSYAIPSRVIHDAKSGPQGATVIATYVVEKGEPLASPAE